MSLYIDPNNQRILWETLHKNPLVSIIFPNDVNSLKRKEIWFKNIISKIYSQMPKNISRETLLNKNKETLTIMNAELYGRKNQPPETANNSTAIYPVKQPETLYSRNAISENRSELLNREYLDRQKQYEQMVQKPNLPEVSFEEKQEDEVIKNMDELIRKQMKEREDDLKTITKSFQPNLNPNSNPISKHRTLSIREETAYIEPIDVTVVEEPPKKRVSWNIEEEPHKTSQNIPVKFEVKIEELAQKVSMLMDFLENKFPNFQEEYELFFTKKIIREILEEEIDKIA